MDQDVARVLILWASPITCTSMWKFTVADSLGVNKIFEKALIDLLADREIILLGIILFPFSN